MLESLNIPFSNQDIESIPGHSLALPHGLGLHSLTNITYVPPIHQVHARRKFTSQQCGTLFYSAVQLMKGWDPSLHFLQISRQKFLYSYYQISGKNVSLRNLDSLLAIRLCSSTSTFTPSMAWHITHNQFHTPS